MKALALQTKISIFFFISSVQPANCQRSQGLLLGDGSWAGIGHRSVLQAFPQQLMEQRRIFQDQPVSFATFQPQVL